MTASLEQAATLQEQMATLLQQGLYDSAELLGHFLRTAANATEAPAGTRAQNTVLLADALVGKKDYKRALSYYRQSLAIIRVPGIKGASGPVLPDEHEVKFKMVRCMIELKEHRNAIAELETVPSSSKTPAMHVTLAKLYQHTGYDRAAILSYKECLRHCPYALEALVALAQLGVPTHELQPLLPQASPSKPGANDVVRWVQLLTEANCAAAARDRPAALDRFTSLSKQCQDNPQAAVSSGIAAAGAEATKDAIFAFQRARALDAHLVVGMDEYALLLQATGDVAELGRLAHELITTNAMHPAAWCAGAAYFDAKHEKAKALSYAERAIALDERHALGYYMKGVLALDLKRPDQAVFALRRAVALRPELRTYQALVRAYLACVPAAKVKEALVYAREALRAAPQSAAALALVGDVYRHHPEATREKAARMYQAALAKDPALVPAILRLAELCVVDGRVGEAITLLQQKLAIVVTDGLHAKLAHALASAQRFPESINHYQAALGLNPANDDARKGLERLEKLIKGVDPDAPEEEGDDSGSGDNDDAEFL
eukprot:jgi/Chlat1/7936/Chrsp68S07367